MVEERLASRNTPAGNGHENEKCSDAVMLLAHEATCCHSESVMRMKLPPVSRIPRCPLRAGMLLLFNCFLAATHIFDRMPRSSDL